MSTFGVHVKLVSQRVEEMGREGCRGFRPSVNTSLLDTSGFRSGSNPELETKQPWPQISALAQQKGNVGMKMFEPFGKKSNIQK